MVRLTKRQTIKNKSKKTQSSSTTINFVKQASKMTKDGKRALKTAQWCQRFVNSKNKTNAVSGINKKSLASHRMCDKTFGSNEMQVVKDSDVEKQNKTTTKNASVNPMKNRAALMASEREQFKRVLGHPAFQANPITSIAEHVQQTTSTTTSKK